MKDVAIIGAGRLGTSLGYALSRQGYRIAALSCRHITSAKESSQIIRGAKPFTSNRQAARHGNLVILSIPDDEVEKVAKELSGPSLLWEKKFVFHCSGLLPSQILAPLQERGALAASIHPIQSFPRKRTAPEAFEEIYFGIEGKPQALANAREIVLKLGGHPLYLEPEHKPLYHAACSMASNFFVVLLETAAFLLHKSGLSGETAIRALFPLVEGTLSNMRGQGIPSSLTGPVSRGDKGTLEIHLEALKKYPSTRKLYVQLALQALELAQKEKALSQKEFKALIKLLEGK